MLNDINNQVLALRRSGGYSLLKRFSLIEISGPDAARFLQSRLSNDVHALQPGQGQMTALLDRKAHILAYVSLHRIGDRFWILAERWQAAILLAQLESFHFREDVVFAERSDLQLWTLQGSKAPLFMMLGLQGAPRPCVNDFDAAEIALWGETVRAFNRSLTGETGYTLAVKTASEAFARFEQEAAALNMVPLSDEALDVARVEAGLPTYAIDMTAADILPETGLENSAASYNKGCFQGQEVLARIRSFGAPKRGLVGLEFAAGCTQTFDSDTVFSLGEAEIGTIKSNVFSPTLKRVIALAFIQREYRVPDQTYKVLIEGREYDVKVVLLPFYSAADKQERAREQYEAALAEFAGGSERQAISMLRDTIDLDPLFADAYESLGVVLSRHDELDEAIALMKRLEALDPSSVMAHTNLSVFYMQQGDKEAAEEEKAKAMSIRMEQMARDFAKQQEQESEKQRRKDEALERMSLFRQVLEIDPDDFLANSGLGAVYVDMEQYAQAIPYLEKALSVKQNHTLTYLSLGQAYAQLGRTEDALEIFKKGVNVAAQRGEMTPMKEMQAHLQRLGT